MDKNSNMPQHNRSMFLYTALIFAVALILIIIAFFGQKNISNLRRTTEQLSAATAAPTATEQADSELARLINTVSALQAENDELKGQLDIYTAITNANAYVSSELYEDAEAALADIDPDALTDEQRILYNQITEQINERKDQ